jgi:subtilisin family serine protease
MNRNNIWIHIGLATVLIVFAAVLGQIERWETTLNVPNTNPAKTVERKIDLPTSIDSSVPEVIVRFKPGVTVEQIRLIATANNDTLVDEIESVNGLTVIDDLDNADAQAIVSQYSAMSDVEYAEPNFEIKLDDPIQKMETNDSLYREAAAGAPNDPLFIEQWALNNSGADGGTKRADLDALKAWETTKGSDEVVVAVLDSGVDYNHADLRENIWTRPASVPSYTDDELGNFNDINGYDANSEIRDPMDDNGHGTHCAGIIGAEGDNGEGVAGINWKVKIMPLKFLGRGGFGSTNGAIEAINYAIDRKKNGVNVRVISASWGSRSKSEALEDTIRAAGDAGILFVAAAGNDSTDNDRRPHYPSNYDLPNVISVAALDRTDNLASFSNFGAKTVHVAAPGKAIVSTWLGNDYREASGTSMATPYVSGVAALIIASEPRISMKNLRERIIKTADKLDVLDGKVASSGRICAANALSNIVKSRVHN